MSSKPRGNLSEAERSSYKTVMSYPIDPTESTPARRGDDSVAKAPPAPIRLETGRVGRYAGLQFRSLGYEAPEGALKAARSLSPDERILPNYELDTIQEAPPVTRPDSDAIEAALRADGAIESPPTSPRTPRAPTSPRPPASPPVAVLVSDGYQTSSDAEVTPDPKRGRGRSRSRGRDRARSRSNSLPLAVQVQSSSDGEGRSAGGVVSRILNGTKRLFSRGPSPARTGSDSESGSPTPEDASKPARGRRARRRSASSSSSASDSSAASESGSPTPEDASKPAGGRRAGRRARRRSASSSSSASDSSAASSVLSGSEDAPSPAARITPIDVAPPSSKEVVLPRRGFADSEFAGAIDSDSASQSDGSAIGLNDSPVSSGDEGAKRAIAKLAAVEPRTARRLFHMPPKSTHVVTTKYTKKGFKGIHKRLVAASGGEEGAYGNPGDHHLVLFGRRRPDGSADPKARCTSLKARYYVSRNVIAAAFSMHAIRIRIPTGRPLELRLVEDAKMDSADPPGISFCLREGALEEVFEEAKRMILGKPARSGSTLAEGLRLLRPNRALFSLTFGPSEMTPDSRAKPEERVRLYFVMGRRSIYLMGALVVARRSRVGAPPSL